MHFHNCAQMMRRTNGKSRNMKRLQMTATNNRRPEMDADSAPGDDNRILRGSNYSGIRYRTKEKYDAR
ncbi:hypothetical protein Bpfe_019023 [Biomphalaria pfeifferi]|uniref:Uncharacterized protein n=1 Tax=Biomphalaria pfeifferi TaxID=112525 RepID=A0AAD8F6B2_BIOPF|nr:hypothetical protein Bpfe_019023 [Biomphalaria pfeifferi]